MDDDVDDSTPGGRIEILRAFLEQHPLYAAGRFNRPQPPMHLSSAWPEAITLACKQCRRETTWMRVDYVEHRGGRAEPAPHVFYDDNYILRFTCARCKKEEAAFWCAVTRTDQGYCIRKQGQSPAWSIEPTAAIAKALPLDVIDFYRKGLICTSHNFGLGAVGYFRRVVEQVVEHLLVLVEENAKVQGDQVTIDSVEDARKAFSATDRLKHAASLLPATLRPGGQNPLARLYESYSEGIHSLTDEQCLEVAREVQAALDYVLPLLHEQLAAARAYQAAMAKATRRK